MKSETYKIDAAKFRRLCEALEISADNEIDTIIAKASRAMEARKDLQKKVHFLSLALKNYTLCGTSQEVKPMRECLADALALI